MVVMTLAEATAMASTQAQAQPAQPLTRSSCCPPCTARFMPRPVALANAGMTQPAAPSCPPLPVLIVLSMPHPPCTLNTLTSGSGRFWPETLLASMPHPPLHPMNTTLTSGASNTWPSLFSLSHACRTHLEPHETTLTSGAGRVWPETLPYEHATPTSSPLPLVLARPGLPGPV